jgi:small conductance mechanosensitive channel
VQQIIQQTVAAMAEDDAWKEKILEAPVVAGVESVTGTSVTIRVTVKCTPNDHWSVQREMRERIKEAFDREGVRVPPPVFPGSPGPL